MRQQRWLLAAALVMLVLAGCSSGGSTATPKTTRATTSTTTSPPTTSPPTTMSPPPDDEKSTVQAFFRGEGAPLLAFRKAAADVAKGRQLAVPVCQAIARSVPQSMQTLIALARKTPSRALSAALPDDVFLKSSMVAECIRSKQFKPIVWKKMRAYSEHVDEILQQYGVPE